VTAATRGYENAIMVYVSTRRTRVDTRQCTGVACATLQCSAARCATAGIQRGMMWPMTPLIFGVVCFVALSKACCALTGEGLYDGMEWLANRIKK